MLNEGANYFKRRHTEMGGKNNLLGTSYLPRKFACLTLLHSERLKLYGVLAFLSAIGLT